MAGWGVVEGLRWTGGPPWERSRKQVCTQGSEPKPLLIKVLFPTGGFQTKRFIGSADMS